MASLLRALEFSSYVNSVSTPWHPLFLSQALISTLETCMVGVELKDIHCNIIYSSGNLKTLKDVRK